MTSQSSSFRGPEAGDRRFAGPPPSLTQPERAPERVLDDELSAGGSPQQREIAQRIYTRLKDGASVDDVKDLIGELSRATTAQARNRRRGGRAPRTGGIR
jgi:hypothetical protein